MTRAPVIVDAVFTRKKELTMNTHRWCWLALALAFGVSAQDSKAPEMTPEQKAMMEAYEAAGKVGPQHEQLKYFEGNWDAKVTMWMDPAAPPEVTDAQVSFKPMFGGRFQYMTHKGVWQGEAFEGIGYAGFDNVRKKFLSTWTDSMSTGFFVMYGDYDAANKTYTYKGDMPDPLKGGAMIPIREVTKLGDNDHFTFEWYETHDGKESRTMQIAYTRRK
jgi:hypothetical protein